MAKRRLIVHALLGPALAGLPGALAWSPGLPPVEPEPGKPVSLDASTPGAAGSTESVALAADEGHVVAVVGASQSRRAILVELGIGKPARFIRSFPRGATQPTVGTDAEGRVVVLLRTCATRTSAGKGADCGIETVGLRTGNSRPLRGGQGADIAAMDRGATVVASGPRLTLTAASAADAKPGRTTSIPRVPAARLGTEPAAVRGLDLRDGVVAATFELSAAFGGSQLARFDTGRGWTTLGVSTDGGAAIGPRAYYAPTITPTGVRAFYDGAEDFPGFAGRWTRAKKPAEEVRAAPLGNPVHLQSAAFLGDRVLVVTQDDSCELSACRVASFGPFPVG